MSISVQCPGCGRKLKAKDELAGKRVNCPGCSTSVAVPIPSAATTTSASPHKAASHKPIIEIQRLEQSWPFSKLPVLVYLNEQKVGRLANGQSHSFEVSPGSHTVEIDSGNARSSAFEVTLEQGESAVFEVELSRGPVVDLVWAELPRKSAIKEIITRRPQRHTGNKILALGLLSFLAGIFGLVALGSGWDAI